MRPQIRADKTILSEGDQMGYCYKYRLTGESFLQLPELSAPIFSYINKQLCLANRNRVSTIIVIITPDLIDIIKLFKRHLKKIHNHSKPTDLFGGFRMTWTHKIVIKA